MDNITKGKSPFYPEQPVPVEFFTGRTAEIERISRAIGQVTHGKLQAVFLIGEYGIGKSSLAGYMKYDAEKNSHLLGIHVFLGGVKTLEDIATKTVEAVLRSEAYEPTITDTVRNALAKYVGKQQLFGVSVNLDALKADAPSISNGYLSFLQELLQRVQPKGINGIMLILDEINGIAANPDFAHFIKTLVDENAVSRKPLPLLLMLCGVDERRRDMIEQHKPVERIFDIVEIEPMNTDEMKDFFTKTFSEAGIRIEEDAMLLLCKNSAGLPKIMHIIGNAVFWASKSNVIDKKTATEGIFTAAEEVGRKFVDQQVYKALRSKDYHSILAKLATDTAVSFQKSDFVKGLSEKEKTKFDNFLQRMKQLNVLKSGDVGGEYIFNSRLVRLYIFLNSLDKTGS